MEAAGSWNEKGSTVLRRHPLAAGFAIALSATLAACSSPTETERGSAETPSQAPDPAPEVSVSAVEDPDADDAAADEGSDDATDAAAGGDAASASGTDLEISPTGHFALTVTGGEFAEVTVTDADHPEVTVAGTFDDGSDADSGDGNGDGTDGDSDAGDAETGDPDAEETESDEAPATSGADAEAQAGGSTADSTEDAGDAAEGDATDGDAADDATDEADDDDASDEGDDSSGSAEPQGTRWVSDYGLAGSATYEWTAKTIAPDGGEHEASGTITTTEPQGRSARVFTVIGDDQEVGVAAPIIVNIGATVPESHRDEIEHRLSVEVTDEDGKEIDVEGSWGWLYDTDGISRVHYRPKEFWPEHSKVKVQMALEDVPFSDTRFGEKDVSLDFSIGREQTTTADAKTHRMVVTRGDETVMDFPASLGAPRSPSYNGTHIVMSKAANYTMTSERWGYSTPVRWAVRIHNNGEFIHGAPWSAGSQGSANVSHGCINLTNERAKEYYDTAIYGDPVIVQGSSVSLSTDASDVSDWVYDWEDWKELSALD